MNDSLFPKLLLSAFWDFSSASQNSGKHSAFSPLHLRHVHIYIDFHRGYSEQLDSSFGDISKSFNLIWQPVQGCLYKLKT